MHILLDDLPKAGCFNNVYIDDFSRNVNYLKRENQKHTDENVNAFDKVFFVSEFKESVDPISNSIFFVLICKSCGY